MKRDKGRKGLQFNSDGKRPVGIGDPPDGVLATERHIRKTVGVELARFEEVRLLDTNHKPLPNHRPVAAAVNAAIGSHWLGVVAVHGHQFELHPSHRLTGVIALENIPQPQTAVTCQVELAAANATNRHANIGEFLPPPNGRCIAPNERTQPLRR